MNFATVTTFTYGILSIVGGIIGYKQAGSKISLISGAISGILLILAGILQLQGQSYAFVLAGVITLILVIFFAFRLQKTRKFMPAGLMTVLGVITLIVIASQFF
ncbi:hypothetical protein NIES4071_74690 [Calothrix sp. NIES-4071]|nr:hypothetical protein NIES4071_74690 [Calothrix sp. NIES-4071]BAZ61744.1 hypothetical protein NIES4105_74640 [Calothrix sp. NIES-4105]